MKLLAGNITLLLLLTFPAAGQAASGLYLQLGIGYGAFGGSELVVQEDTSQAGDFPDTDPDRCCPPAGLAGQFNVGFSIFGFGGPEARFAGNGWDLGGQSGGAGFAGGGIRLFPIQFFSLVGMDVSDIPIDLGIGAHFGYVITGEDFLYEGTFFDVDFNLEYELASFLSAGVKVDIMMPRYSDFAITSFKNNTGRCLDSGANQDLENQMVPVDRDSANCNGRGPNTTYISPQIVLTFKFDVFDPL